MDIIKTLSLELTNDEKINLQIKNGLFEIEYKGIIYTTQDGRITENQPPKIIFNTMDVSQSARTDFLDTTGKQWRKKWGDDSFYSVNRVGGETKVHSDELYNLLVEARTDYLAKDSKI